MTPTTGVHWSADGPFFSLRSKRFRAVQKQKTRNESQRLREKWRKSKGGSCFISRAAKNENPVPRVNRTETLATQAPRF